MRPSDTFYDADVAEAIFQTAERLPVDVDAAWARLCEQLEREPARAPRALTRLLLIAAAIAALLLVGRPVVISGALATVHFVKEVVGLETIPTTAPPTTTTTAPPTTTTTGPPTTTVSITAVPPTTTTTTAPVSAGHSELINGTDFERSVRQVHIQLNEAIGFQARDFGALQGSPELVESLIGLQPQYDPRLRDLLGNLREAIRNNNFDAAKAAHRIVHGIEVDLGTSKY